MSTYDDETLEPISPELSPEERPHVVIAQDETTFSTNEMWRHFWLAEGQQPLQKKGNGCCIHVSDFICETT
jgi:hypothetical protein